MSTKPKRTRLKTHEIEKRLREVVERHKRHEFRNALDLALKYDKPQSFATRMKLAAISKGMFVDEAEWASFYTTPRRKLYRLVCPQCGFAGRQQRKPV